MRQEVAVALSFLLHHFFPLLLVCILSRPLSAKSTTSDDGRRTVTVPEAARQLGISRAFAYNAIARGIFPVRIIRIGGRIVVSRAALDAYLRCDHTQEVGSEA